MSKEMIVKHYAFNGMEYAKALHWLKLLGLDDGQARNTLQLIDTMLLH